MLNPRTGTNKLEKPAVLIIGPTPPPFHGPAVSTQLILNSDQFCDIRLIHLDTSDRRGLETVGRFEVGNILLGIKHLLQFLALLARFRPKLVYLPVSQGAAGYLRDAAFLLPCRWFRIPSIVHLRGSEFPSFYRCSSPAMRWLIRYSLRKVRRAVVLGNNLRSQFDGLVLQKRVVVIPNGTEDIFGSQPSQDKDNSHLQCLYLSNYRVRKGIFETLEAAIQTLMQFSNVSFTFAGVWDSPGVRRQIMKSLDACEVSDRIHFVGSVYGAKKTNLLMNSDIFIFPPIEPEGHPRVILEAMSAGLPVITTDQGAISESVIDGKNGFIVKTGSVSEIIEKIAFFVNDHALQKEMGKASRELFLENFTGEKSNVRLAQLFLEVIRGT